MPGKFGSAVPPGGSRIPKREKRHPQEVSGEKIYLSRGCISSVHTRLVNEKEKPDEKPRRKKQCEGLTQLELSQKTNFSLVGPATGNRQTRIIRR